MLAVIASLLSVAGILIFTEVEWLFLRIQQVSLIVLGRSCTITKGCRISFFLIFWKLLLISQVNHVDVAFGRFLFLLWRSLCFWFFIYNFLF